MNKICLYLFLIISYNTFSQTNKIVYSLEIVIDKNEIINKEKVDFLNQLNQSFKHFSFELKFNDTISEFSIPETMSVVNKRMAEAISFAGLEKPIYCYNGNTYSYGEEDLLKEKTFLVKSEMTKNWTIHNDTISVNGYKCYKATSLYSNDSESTFTEIAWFCPSIPGKFGPYGTGNLPGMILIYQHASNIYKAQNIILNSKEKIDFKLTEKIISEKEYIDLWRKWEEDEFGTD